MPVVGDAIAAGAKAAKAVKAVNTGIQAARATTSVARGSETARSVAASTTRSATREVGTVRATANRGAGNVERVSGATRGSTSGGGSLRGDRSTGRASNSQPPRGNSGGGGNKPPTPFRSGQPNSPRRLELEAPPRRLAIEGRTTARPLYDRGARPGPGQRSLTQEQWKKLRGDQRANQNVQRIPGHGHARHGSQMTAQQLIDRVNNGSLPNGTTRSVPNRATRFDSARRELEAVGRARAQLRAEGNGRPVFRVDSRGIVERERNVRAYTVPGSRGSYGRGVEVRRGGNNQPLPGRPIRRTAQEPNARVVFEYDSIARQWKEKTHFPTH